jgi:uncharacterized protein YneF (UPF0154 family)
MRYILYALAIWFLYKLIFGFIIPVYRATRQMKQQFRKMHDQMQQEQVKQQGFGSGQADTKSKEPQTRAEDYIDFEEIK